MLLNKHSVILKIDIHLLADRYRSGITLKQQKIQCTYLLDRDHHVTGRIGLVKLLTQPQIRQGFFVVVVFFFHPESIDLFLISPQSHIL